MDLRIKSCRRGFTLVEIVLVLVLLSVIILLAISKFPTQSAKAKADAERQASAISCWVECVSYYKTVKLTYPSTLTDAKDLGQCFCSDVENLSYNNDSNGVYFCFEQDLNTPYDLTEVKIMHRLIPGSYLASSCPSDEDEDLNVGQTAYLTVWLSKK